MIPYGRQTIEEDDIQAVVSTLRSEFLTQGPKVSEFETALAAYAGAKEAVVFANGTLALLAAYAAAGLQSGDTFVTTPLTFAATATAGLWHGAKPLFTDVRAQDGLMWPEHLTSLKPGSCKLLVSVDFSGHPVHYDGLRAWAQTQGVPYISDAAHSWGATYRGQRVGSLADMTLLSFHPVKSMTTAEGGAVLTDNAKWAEAMRQFRGQGARRTADYYEIESLGTNARLTDMQCALGLSQLRKLDRFVAARQERAEWYRLALHDVSGIQLPRQRTEAESAWHLYPIRLSTPALVPKRWEIVRSLREKGIGAQVHYVSLTRHPLLRSAARVAGGCGNAEMFGDSEISLPMYPTLSRAEVDTVVKTLKGVLSEFHERAHVA